MNKCKEYLKRACTVLLRNPARCFVPFRYVINLFGVRCSISCQTGEVGGWWGWCRDAVRFEITAQRRAGAIEITIIPPSFPHIVRLMFNNLEPTTAQMSGPPAKRARTDDEISSTPHVVIDAATHTEAWSRPLVPPCKVYEWVRMCGGCPPRSLSRTCKYTDSLPTIHTHSPHSHMLSLSLSLSLSRSSQVV
jgi:hypothetical protein